MKIQDLNNASPLKQTDPKFIYGNKAALELWEANWDQLIGMPSRLSAAEDPDVQKVGVDKAMSSPNNDCIMWPSPSYSHSLIYR